MEKRENTREISFLAYGKSSLLGGASAFLTALAAMLAFSLGISRGMIPTDAEETLVLAACALGSAVGGWVAARSAPERELLLGPLTGGILFLLQLTVGLLVYSGSVPERGSLAALCVCLCGGTLAALLCRRGRRPDSRRKRKYRQRRA